MTHNRTWILWALMTMVWPATGRTVFLRPVVFQETGASPVSDFRTAAFPAFSPKSGLAAEIEGRMPSVGPVLGDVEIRMRDVSARSA